MNTDTPILTSLAASDTRQTVSPHGQDSTVYTMDVNGTQIIITNKSASANERMYLKQNYFKFKINIILQCECYSNITRLVWILQIIQFYKSHSFT